MRKILSVIVLLAWAMWIGGVATLALSVGTLFKTYDRTTAGQGAMKIFYIFERYQLALAIVLFISLIAWIIARQALSKAVILICVLLSAIMAVALPTTVSPRIVEMTAKGETDTKEFKRVHTLGEQIYKFELTLLAIAGVLLPTAMRADAKDLAKSSLNNSDSPTDN